MSYVSGTVRAPQYTVEDFRKLVRGRTGWGRVLKHNRDLDHLAAMLFQEAVMNQLTPDDVRPLASAVIGVNPERIGAAGHLYRIAVVANVLIHQFGRFLGQWTVTTLQLKKSELLLTLIRELDEAVSITADPRHPELVVVKLKGTTHHGLHLPRALLPASFEASLDRSFG